MDLVQERCLWVLHALRDRQPDIADRMAGSPDARHAYPDHPNLPCEWYIYKFPEAVPDEAYTSVGKEPPERSA